MYRRGGNMERKYMQCRRYPLFPADDWPQVFDDSEARRDWGWRHKYNLERLVESMVRDVSANYLPKMQMKQINR